MAIRRPSSPDRAIVHIASRAAIRAKEGHGAYSASKAGILQLTQMAAVEGARHRAVVAHVPDLKLGARVQIVRWPRLGSVHLRFKAIEHPDFVAERNQRIHEV